MKIVYKIYFQEKLLDLEGTQRVSSFELDTNQLLIFVYDLQEKQSFNVLTKTFSAIDKDLKALMERAYASERKQTQVFIGWQEDETIEQFTDKITQSKSRKMVILLGNKCDYDYDSAREVTEKQVETFIDQYTELNMVQGEVSAINKTGLQSVSRAIQFFTQKFLTEQDLSQIIKISQIAKNQKAKVEVVEEQKSNVPKKRGPPNFGNKMKAKKESIVEVPKNNDAGDSPISQQSPQIQPQKNSEELIKQTSQQSHQMNQSLIPQEQKNISKNENIPTQTQLLSQSQWNQYQNQANQEPSFDQKQSQSQWNQYQNQAYQEPQFDQKTSQQPNLNQKSQQLVNQQNQLNLIQNQPSQGIQSSQQKPLQSIGLAQPNPQPISFEQQQSRQLNQNQAESKISPQNQIQTQMNAEIQPSKNMAGTSNTFNQNQNLQKSTFGQQQTSQQTQLNQIQNNDEQSVMPKLMSISFNQNQMNQSNQLSKSIQQSTNNQQSQINKQSLFQQQQQNNNSMNQSKKIERAEGERPSFVERLLSPNNEKEQLNNNMMQSQQKSQDQYSKVSQSSIYLNQSQQQLNQMEQSQSAFRNQLQPQQQTNLLNNSVLSSQKSPSQQSNQSISKSSIQQQNPNALIFQKQNSHQQIAINGSPNQQESQKNITASKQIKTVKQSKFGNSSPNQSQNSQVQEPSFEISKFTDQSIKRANSRVLPNLNEYNQQQFDQSLSSSWNQQDSFLSDHGEGKTMQYSKSDLGMVNMNQQSPSPQLSSSRKQTSPQHNLSTSQLLQSHGHRVVPFQISEQKTQSKIINKSQFNLVADKMLNKNQNAIADLVDQLKAHQLEDQIDEKDESSDEDYLKISQLTGDPKLNHSINLNPNFNFNPTEKKKDFSFHESSKIEEHNLSKKEIVHYEEDEEQLQDQAQQYNYDLQGPKLIYQSSIGNKPFSKEGSKNSIIESTTLQNELKLSITNPHQTLQLTTPPPPPQFTNEEVKGRNPIKSLIERPTIQRKSIALETQKIEKIDQSIQAEIEVIHLMPKSNNLNSNIGENLNSNSKYPHIEQLIQREVNQKEFLYQMQQYQQIQSQQKKDFEQLKKISKIVKSFYCLLGSKSVNQKNLNQPIMYLAFHLSKQFIQQPVFQNDDASSLAQKLISKLKIQPTENLIENLSQLITTHIDHFCDKLNKWIQIKKLGRLDGTKWKVQVYKNPEMLQMIENEEQENIQKPSQFVSFIEVSENQSHVVEKDQDSNNLIKRQVSLKKILNEQIGILHVDLNDNQPPLQIYIYKEDDTQAIVQKFLNEHNLPMNEETIQNLQNGIQKIQSEWHQKQKQSKSPPSRLARSPASSTIIVQNFKINDENNQEDIYISAMIHLGSNKKAKLIIKKNEVIKKAVEKFGIKNKLTAQMKDKLLNQIMYNYQQSLNKKSSLI